MLWFGGSGMTGQQFRMARQVLALLESEIGLTDDALAERSHVKPSDLRPVLGALYGRRKIDFCAGYVVLPPQPGGR
jgi:transcription initiation factor IIE alpha subunit